MNELDYIPDIQPQDAPDAPAEVPPAETAPIPLAASVAAVERLLRPLQAGIVEDPWDGLGPPGDKALKKLPPEEKERALLSPNFIRTAGLLAVRGFSESDIAEAFGVGLAVVRGWEREYPDFKECLSRCKDIQDAAVERSLYNIAVGYTVPDVKITTDKDGLVTRTPYIKHYPPDVRAATTWLYNRRPDRWRPVAPDPESSGQQGSRAAGVVDNRVQVVVFSPHAAAATAGQGLGPGQQQQAGSSRIIDAAAAAAAEAHAQDADGQDQDGREGGPQAQAQAQAQDRGGTVRVPTGGGLPQQNPQKTRT